MFRITVWLGIGIITSGLLITFCSSQNFDPNMKDKEYLDGIHKRLREEVMEAHAVLVNQTKILQQVTRSFIESKIKENLFKAVRARVEVELEEMAKGSASSNSSSRQGRQEDDDDDDNATLQPGLPSRPGLLPQLANVVTTLFGPNANVTGYVKDATSFLPADLSKRFIVAASLIDPTRFSSTVPPPLIINGQVVPQNYVNGPTLGYPVNSAGTLIQGGLNQAPVTDFGSSTGGVQQGIVQPGILSPQQLEKIVSNPVGTISVSGAQVPQQKHQQRPNAQRISSAPLSSNLQQAQSATLQQPLFGNPQQNQHQSISNLPSNTAQRQEQVGGTSQFGIQQQQQPQLTQNSIRKNNAGFVGGNVNNQLNYQLLPQQQQQQFQPIRGGFVPNNGIPLTTNEIFNSVNLSPTVATVPPTVPQTSNEDNYDNSSGAEEESDNGPSSFIPKNPENVDSGEVVDDFVEDDIDISVNNNKTRPSTKQDKGDTGYLDEYLPVKYAIRLFNRFTQTEIPTTTEYMNVTSTNSSLNQDYYVEDDKMAPTSATTPPSVSRIVQGGVYLYEGAKEAYHFLQHINRFLDRVNERFENAGYGSDSLGINVEERKE